MSFVLTDFFNIGGQTTTPKRNVYDSYLTRMYIISEFIKMMKTDPDEQIRTIIRSCFEWIRFIHEMHPYIVYTEKEPYILLNLTDDTIANIDSIYEKLFTYLYRLDRLGMADSQVYQTILYIRFSAKRYILFRDEPMSAAATETGYLSAQDMYQTITPELITDLIDLLDTPFSDDGSDLIDLLDTPFSDDESEPSGKAETGAAGPLVKKRRKQVQLRL